MFRFLAFISCVLLKTIISIYQTFLPTLILL